MSYIVIRVTLPAELPENEARRIAERAAVKCGYDLFDEIQGTGRTYPTTDQRPDLQSLARDLPGDRVLWAVAYRVDESDETDDWSECKPGWVRLGPPEDSEDANPALRSNLDLEGWHEATPVSAETG